MTCKPLGLTLIELILAIILISIITLGIVNIDYFSHYHVINASRRSEAQNKASTVLAHMAKEISKAIGNEIVNGQDTVVAVVNNPTNRLINVYIDANGNGEREPPIVSPGLTDDHWISYRWDSSAAAANRNQVRYCSRCKDSSCNIDECVGDKETISTDITNFIPPSPPALIPAKPVNSSQQLNNNFVTIQVQACWNPSLGSADSPDNPCVNMSSRIKMPSVSTN